MPVKFISTLLLAVMFSVVLGGAYQSAHAGRYGAASCWEEASVSPSSLDGQCPCCPLEPEADHQDCDASCDCACHASLTIHTFSLCYNPVLTELQTFESFTFLPEVFLAKFVPPQLTA